MLKECRKLKSDDLIVWHRVGTTALLAGRCASCGGAGRFFLSNGEHLDCEECVGCGWFGIDPRVPVQAQPGSVEKIAMLTVRYASGVPLFNGRDGQDADQRVFNGRDGQDADQRVHVAASSRTAAPNDERKAPSARPLTHRSIAGEHAAAESEPYAANLAP
jgi:hypothetical protein